MRKIKSDRWAEGDETAYVVEEWWRCTDKVEFSWKRLKEAINNAIEVTEQSNKSQQTSDGKEVLSEFTSAHWHGAQKTMIKVFI